MAVDKNSKAYQWLLAKGYTDEQINQMHNDVANWKTTQEALSSQYDPMKDLTPEYIANMDMNKQISGANQAFNQYGDDSSSDKQSTLGWMNEKYTGEGVKNDQLNYDENLKLSDLNPNFVYWKQSQVYGTDHPWYITQRNDQIASALYNEWLTSRDDVANFLTSQSGFFNSSEADRLNTIEAVYKRLWAIAEQNQPEEQPDLSKADQIVQDTSGKIYGKTTAEEWDPSKWINTLADANSVFTSMEQARVAKVRQLASMDSERVWMLMSEWRNPFSDQTMRDLQQYFPEKYSEIQSALKKIQWQQNIDNISLWDWLNVTSQLTASESNVTTSMNTFVNSTASGSAIWTLATNLNNALAESEIVSTAREQMEVYKRKIQDIQAAANELPSLANQYFKWDVPQYMVQAFINNRLQQYNKEIEKYQNLYNATLEEAQMEISQTQWREEMNYKWSSLQADQNYKNANLELSRQELEYNRQKAAIANWQWNDDGSYSYVDLDWQLHTLSAEEAQKALNSDLYNKATSYIDYWKNLIDQNKAAWTVCKWWQCEAMTDNYAKQNFGTEMKKADGSSWATTVDEKARYATEALPQRWYVAVFDFWIKQSDGVNYWHTWIVIDYDPTTWDFTTLESNIDWQWTVEVKTRNINSANLLWFRDPTQWEPWTKKGSSTTNSWIYYYHDTPMREKFEQYAAENDKTEQDRNDIKLATNAYELLYDLERNGYIQQLFELKEKAETTKSSGLRNNIKSMFWSDAETEWDLFIEMLKSEEYYDDNQNLKVSALENDIRRGFTNGEDLAYLFTRLRELVTTKLRKDSGAAINKSEWMWSFQQYLPEAWQWAEFIFNKLNSLEHDTVYKYMPVDKRWEYISVFPQTWDEYKESHNIWNTKWEKGMQNNK